MLKLSLTAFSHFSPAAIKGQTSQKTTASRLPRPLQASATWMWRHSKLVACCEGDELAIDGQIFGMKLFCGISSGIK